MLSLPEAMRVYREAYSIVWNARQVFSQSHHILWSSLCASATHSLLQSVELFYTTIKAEPYRMSEAAAATVQAGMTNILEKYQELSAMAHFADPRENRWHQVPNRHYFYHLGDVARWGSPRFHWTYVDEDFMGQLQTISPFCFAGTRSHTVMTKIIRKWLRGVVLRIVHRQN